MEKAKTEHKLTKKELKAPDEILVIGRSVMSWLTENAMILLAGFAIAFVGLLVGIFVYQQSLKTEGEAEYHYSMAREAFEQYRLENPSKQDADKKTDLAEKAKNLEKVKTELDLLSKKFPNSKANNFAYSIRADLALQSKDWKSAEEDYKKYSEALPHSEKAWALYPQAIALENDNKWDEAFRIFSNLANEKDSYFAQLALMGKARVLKAQGKTSEADAAYQEFLTKFPTSTESSSVRGFKELLSGP